MSRERITIETDESGRSQVSGGQLDGAPVISKAFATAPLILLSVVPALGPNGQPGVEVNIDSPAHASPAEQLAVLEMVLPSLRKRLERQSW